MLNLHVAYRRAPGGVLDAFATIVRGRGYRTAAVREAAERVRNWQGLEPVMEAVRTSHAQRLRLATHRCRQEDALTRSCATPAQQAYLQALYRYLNRSRFDGLLPEDTPVRLSNRMATSLGHVIPAQDPRRGRYIVEIALNVDLMLEGNGAERMDTLLHEMAHVADWLFDGQYGHGETWRKWARHAGCRAETKYDRPVVRRRRRGEPVTRVPPLPPALRRRAA